MAFQKKLINDPNDVVIEFIEGLVETYPGLQHLDGFPAVKVVLRADVSSATYDKVAVISGGGTGHEPAHAGFVGEGMLTTAICGDVFTSPPVDSILAGIRAVTGARGCLLIVKHGEPGAAVVDLQPVDVIISHVLKQILSAQHNRSAILFWCFY
ncbi:hypothetical protein HHK36_030311 [Tetracentron sinense]|uniref:DhaK domain-containing protein n=1 Tax=Tetracentron sinense TaxID=13715 RepID=A0A834YAW5_TETSI|nr:hypothetical protein HHK36_030311 [Tetracentron sinense]